MKTQKAIDLFCGCGGISSGLEWAGFEIVAGVDMEKKYMATFTHNFPLAKSICADLSALHPEEFLRDINLEKGELDLLAGGPPCQGFSKNVPRKHRFLEDSRNLLIKTFLNYCETLEPRFVLMENVAEMKNGFDQRYSAEILERLGKAGYSVTHMVLNAADYGVPQRRRRAFFLAAKGSTPLPMPVPTHVSPSKKDLISDAHVSVWDAIGDLPSLKHGEGIERAEYACAPFSQFQTLMRYNSPGFVKNHLARPLQPRQFERLSCLEPGQGHGDLPVHLQTKGGYSGAYGRLTKDMIAPTITRWVFHPGSGRWGHPVDIRTLTMREAARIQSFPDHFEFVGSFNEQAGQIGNAVPPLLAKKLAETMLAHVTASRLDSSLENSAKESRLEGQRKVLA